MQTRYLLLRNNKQSGPYSIDDLIGQQLKPTDLLWIEGKSRAWLHPYEMEEFTPTFTKATVSKSTIKTKKEITDQTTSTERVNFDTPQFSTSVSQTTSNSNYNSSKPVHDTLEEVPIRFVFHKKKAPVNYGHVAGTMIALALLFMGWQRGWFPIHHTDASETVVVPLISSESHTAKARHTIHSTPVMKQEVQQPTVLSDAPVQTANAPLENTTTELTPAVSRTTTPVVKERKTKKVSKPIIAPTVIKQEAITPDLIPAKTDDAAIKSDMVPISEPAKTEAKPEASEKKKGFGLFRGLFHKKKKDDNAQQE